MKYGIRNRAMNLDWQDSLRAAAEIGYDGVELIVANDEELSRLALPDGAAKVLSWCEDSNCKVSSLSVASYRSYTFSLPDVDMDRSVEFVEESLRAAANLNAEGVLLPHFERENIDLDESGEAAFIDGFARCAPAAEELRVNICLETSFSVEQLNRIVDGVGSRFVGVYQDVANALHYGHEPIDMFLRLTGKRIPMIHIKEKDGEYLGEGVLDWGKCTAAIHEIGYDGWLVLETKPTDDPLHAAERNLKFIRDAINKD